MKSVFSHNDVTCFCHNESLLYFEYKNISGLYEVKYLLPFQLYGTRKH